LIGVVMAVLLAGIAGERLRLFARGGTDLQRFDRQTYRVVHVVDGDTVHLRSPGGGETTRVRLLGLDAPELHPRSSNGGGAPEPAYWAHNATDYLRQRLQDRDVIVRLEPLNHRDQYDRLLAYLYLDESDMVN